MPSFTDIGMPLYITWYDVAVRLVLTVIAGALIGLNRGVHGQSAGLRTTVLVGLAASISMIQVNFLLPMSGKGHDSFAVMDLMRLPLGILSGMGFIGGGAILRRGDAVKGVTTAATLWFTTVMGLCIGGGQILLGTTALGFGMTILWGLKRAEEHIPLDRHATLVIDASMDSPAYEAVRRTLSDYGYSVGTCEERYATADGKCEMLYQVTWRASASEVATPGFVKILAASPGVISIAWQPRPRS